MVEWRRSATVPLKALGPAFESELDQLPATDTKTLQASIISRTPHDLSLRAATVS